MSCVWMLQRGHSGDGCVLASTLCKYDLRTGGTSDAGKYPLRAANVCTLYVIATCG